MTHWQWNFPYACCMLLLSFIWTFSFMNTAVGKVIVLDTNSLEIASFRDALSHFGTDLSASVRGHLTQAIPRNGCTKMQYPPYKGQNNATWYGWIALIEKGDCYFDIKVLNAQKAHYVAAIVYNPESDDLIPMASHSVGHQVIIPSVFIGHTNASYLLKFDNSMNYTVLLISDGGSFFNSDIMLPFVIVVGLCLLLMVILLVGKWVQGIRNERRSRLSSRHLKKLPVKRFEKGDKYDVCAICLEEYECGEKLRVLPCAHAYHVKCIDHWLTKRKRTCPICKRKLYAKEDNDTDSDSDSEIPNETAPLLGTSSQRTNNTFDDTNLPNVVYASDSSTETSESSEPDASFYQSSVDVHDSSLGNSIFYSADLTLQDTDEPVLVVDGQCNYAIQVDDDDIRF